MSYQILLLPHDPLELIEEYQQLKHGAHFNECMFKHYRHLYRKHRRGWKFWKATMAFLRMAHYEQAMYEAKINELQTQLKKDTHVGHILTT